MAQKSKAEKAKAERVKAKNAKARAAKRAKAEKAKIRKAKRVKAREAEIKKAEIKKAEIKKAKPKKKNLLGITKFEMVFLLWTLRNQIRYAVDKDSNTIALRPMLRSMATFIEKAGKKADTPWRAAFDEQANALRQLSYALDHGGIVMRKIELGITPKELMAMLPGLIAEIWPHYSDDQRITVDEGILIAASVFEALADPTDDEYVKAFFEAQGAALRSLAPLFEPEEKDEE